MEHEDICVWTEVDFDYHEGIEFKTTCFDNMPEEALFLFTNKFYPGFYPDNMYFRYCPYCGKPIKVIYRSEER